MATSVEVKYLVGPKGSKEVKEVDSLVTLKEAADRITDAGHDVQVIVKRIEYELLSPDATQNLLLRVTRGNE
jgi:uncharacterized protein with PhoU and TrkA domain